MNTELEFFINDVRDIIDRRVAVLLGQLANIKGGAAIEMLRSGKMLRTRLAGRLCGAGPQNVDIDPVKGMCAAVELVHTGSLCHDDVIDSGLIRRHMPSLWRHTGTAGAVLLGDILLCEAMQLITRESDNSFEIEFLSKVKEVVWTEAMQEIGSLNASLSEADMLSIARGKTGPLFALSAMVCAASDPELARALEESGYRVGTAYQLADDLLDVVGSEETAGKTLGTDHLKGKPTLPQKGRQGMRRTEYLAMEMLDSAVECLNEWPQYQNTLEVYVKNNLMPVIKRHGLTRTGTD